MYINKKSNHVTYDYGVHTSTIKQLGSEEKIIINHAEMYGLILYR